MIKRVVEISAEPLHLSVKNEQLVLSRPQTHELVGSVPCEDVGVLLTDQAQATYSHYALMKLAEHGAVVLICGKDHLPCAMLAPLSTNSQVVPRIDAQIEASLPFKKRLWKVVVCAKIRAQASNLAEECDRRHLLALVRRVKSGDSSNVEAHAAKFYWSKWLEADVGFHRDSQGGDSLNVMLNYGYAVLRAAVARAIVAAGLLPVLGIHHCDRSNAFCLADDLVEPLRPFVDARVRALHLAGQKTLSREAKQVLLGVLNDAVRIGEETGPLQVCTGRMVASFVSSLVDGDADLFVIPERA